MASRGSLLFAFPLHPVSPQFEHFSTEQRACCDCVQVMQFFMHVVDDALCQVLDGGAYAWANITSADMRLNCRCVVLVFSAWRVSWSVSLCLLRTLLQW